MVVTPLAWAAFWLSLAVPGTGQVLARSWTSVPWFLAVASLVGVGSTTRADNIVLVDVARSVMLLILGIASALHARRLCLRQSTVRLSRTARRVDCLSSVGRRVQLSICVTTSLSMEELWRRISDLPQFLTIDPFHERVVVMRPTPAAGVDLVLDHNAFGIRLRRVGKILWWREGEGYAISDLSRHHAHRAFPHVFTFRVGPAQDTVPSGRAVLRVDIRGKWTSRVIPAWLGRLWLVGVCREHARMLQQALAS